MIDPFYTYGNYELSVWRVQKCARDKGIFWFQTTSRAFARKLAKRKDTRRVEVTGWNHFRATYEMMGNWRKVKRIVDRYFLSAPDDVSRPNSVHEASDLSDGHNTAAVSPDVVLSVADYIWARK